MACSGADTINIDGDSGTDPNVDKGEAYIILTVEGPGKVLVSTETEYLGECDSNCRFTVEVDDLIKLESNPFEGSVFLGWSGDCGGAHTVCEITLDEPYQERIVGASFASVSEINFELELEDTFLIIPENSIYVMRVGFRPLTSWDYPMDILYVKLEGDIFGDAVDQINYRYIPELSSPEEGLYIELLPGIELSAGIQAAGKLVVGVINSDVYREVGLTVYIARCSLCE